ncbi:D-2-hydroxyacid dehydrogenase [Caenimonas soli]|uniref:D-2-hydroxyacid dehydrogenase n=1 Tax=Caenimonas soli TaxID=2735555 RepID=UPI001F3BFE71|nr:D-2-hydroxyacid dehydrogenase [Caenimonas soli]
MKPRVLVYTKYSTDLPRFVEMLSPDAAQADFAFATTPEEAAPHLPTTEILYGWGFPLAMTKSMPRLKWIQKMGAGVEDVSGVKWPFKDSVILTRTDGRLIAPRMVEYVLAAVLRRTLKTEATDSLRRRREWGYVELGSVRQETIGIAGLGEIGSEVAKAFRALGAKVVGWRRSDTPSPEVDRLFVGPEGLRDFLSSASTVVLVLPKTDETRRLIGREALAAVRPGVHLVNVGRGDLVDEPALLEALDSGRVGHATMDVFATEPLPPEHPFWDHPKVSMTPHLSGPLIPEDVAPHFLRNLQAYLERGTLQNVVDPQRQY